MAKRSKPKADVSDPAVKMVLAALFAAFNSRGLGADALQRDYEGPVPSDLKSQCCADGITNEVDYDLAFRRLLAADLVRTGPMKMLPNDLRSEVLILGFRSENKYPHLTEAGYQEAGKLRMVKPPRIATSNVHISGTFHNSPIGVGNDFSQSLNLNTATTDQLIERLREEVTAQIGDQSRQQEILVDALQAARNKPTRIERYMQVMGAIGDHITVLSFLLTPLLHSLQQ